MQIAIGTRKGLWAAERQDGEWQVSQPLRQTAEFSSVAFVPRGPDERPRMVVGARSWFWGPSVLTSDDGGATWSDPAAGAISFPAEAGAALERVWTLEPDPYEDGVVWAGCEPHSLWRSTDGGQSFSLNQALWDHPHRADWQPGAGGPAVHTVRPRADGSMLVAMSTGGVYRSEDKVGGWTPANQGIRVEFQPDEYPAYGQCVHRIALDSGDQNRVYAQNHGGVYRSDDSGDSWIPIMDGLPVDFGFVVLTHPSQAGTAWVVPISTDTMLPPEGRLRLWRTDDAGGSWREVGAGLPDSFYGTVLRDAAHIAEVDGSVVIAFGTRNGSVFASTDGGETFEQVADTLPDVLSVRVGA